MSSRQRASLLAALSLLSCGALLFEIALTRILSVFLFYHYTFLVMSGAVLGLGLGGLLIYKQTRTSPSSSDSLALIGVLGTAAAVATVATVALFRQGLPIPHPLIYLPLALLPFVPVGMASALAFSHFTPHSGRLYAADLGGAAVGALLAVPLLNRMGGIGTALVAATLMSGAALTFAWGSGRRPARWAAATGGLLTAALLAYHLSTGGFDLRVQGIRLKEMSRGMHSAEEPGQLVHSEWDAFARTDVVAYPDAPGQMAVFLDGASASSLRRFPPTPEEKTSLQATLGYLPFRTGTNRKVLAIGPGGGEDVVLALLSGSEQITAVEINPEGRSFLRRSDEQHDLIYMSKAVTQAADRTGFALTENYLYTVEAFDDYLDHLAPNGRLALILHDQHDLTRAFVTALAALVNRGQSPAEASRHLVLINGRTPEPGRVWYPLLLLKKSPFTQQELEGAFLGAVAGGFEPLFVPEMQEQIPFGLFSQDNVSLDAFVSQVVGMNATPTTDDRPFFYALMRGLPVSLLAVMVISLALIVVAVCAPAAPRRSEAGKQSMVLALYFAALGVGFMIVEVAIIQRFSLFLGYPTLSLTVTLVTLLVAGGIGGWFSQRVPDGRLSTAAAGTALGVSLLLVGYIRFTPWLTNRFLAAALPLRITLTVAMTAPLGLLVGVPFPTGLRWLRAKLGADDKNLAVARVWGINGLASVLGSTAAVAVAMLGGFSWSLLLGSLVYLGVFAGGALYARPVEDSVPRSTPQSSPTGARPGLQRSR
jgi:hypothetical protein